MNKIFFRKYWIYLFAVAFLLLHLPFLSADPPVGVSWSRGPWTDEGQYLAQIRNLINNEHLDVNESGTFVGAPLFSFVMYPLFIIFGTKLVVARCFVMICTLLSFIFIIRKRENHTGWIISLTLVASQFYIFQYTHFAQAELLQCDCILLALLFYSLQRELPLSAFRKRYWYIFLACLWISISFWTKINTAYLLLLIPMSFSVELFLAILQREGRKDAFFRLLAAMLFTVLLCAVYFVGWYLPFREVFALFSGNSLASATGFTLSLPNYIELFIFNYHTLINDHSLVFYLFLTAIILVVFVILCCFRKTRLWLLGTSSPIIFIFFFFCIEMHKMGYRYLPSRYLIPTIVAACLMIGFGLEAMLMARPRWLAIVVLFLAMIVANNIRYYVKAVTHRHYMVKELNDYLGRYDLQNETIIGPWAPTATWVCKSRSLPIWRENYYHYDPIRRFHPRIIISENDESDSDSAYSKQGISLSAISDSSRQFNIHFWKPVVYWLKQ